MKPDDAGRPGIQSVETAAAILGTLAEGGGQLALREIATATGMPRGKIHRYLISLTRAGLVAQSERNGAYGIGPLAISVGLVGLRRVDPVRIAYDALPALRDRVDETVFLAIWGEMGATVIALEESTHPVTLNVRIGSVLPLLSSAAGRVFAAYLPANRIARAIEGERARTSGARDPGRKDFEAAVADIRRDGLSRIRGTLIPGLNALAAPVFDYRGDLASVVGIVGRQETLDVTPDCPAERALAAAAVGLSRRLGHPPREDETG